jgi:hypothetical protein
MRAPTKLMVFCSIGVGLAACASPEEISPPVKATGFHKGRPSSPTACSSNSNFGECAMSLIGVAPACLTEGPSSYAQRF